MSHFSDMKKNVNNVRALLKDPVNQMTMVEKISYVHHCIWYEVFWLGREVTAFFINRHADRLDYMEYVIKSRREL